MAQESTDVQTAAEWLSEETGRPVAEFEVPDDLDYPDLEELESVDPGEVYGSE